MKKTSRTTEIIVERSETWVVRKAGKSCFAWCDRCGERMRMLTPEGASITLGVNTREIYQLIEAGRVHFTETPEGLLLVCLKSLG